MKTTRHGNRPTLIILLTAGFLLFSLVRQPAPALASDNLGGYLHLTASSSKSDGNTDKSLNQEYTLQWHKLLTPYLQSRASIRYFNLGVDQNLSQNTWRREYQPTAEIVWAHPQFVLGGNIRRQVQTSSTEATDLIRNNLSLNFATKYFKYPILTARLDLDHTYNDRDRTLRDTRDKRMQMSLNYGHRSQTFFYSLVRRVNDNELSPVSISEWQHLFRWNQTSRLFSDRFRFSSGYSFNFHSQTTTRTGAGMIYTEVPFSRALYTYDPTPDLGSLDSLNGLYDGNITDPAMPLVDIGEGLLDRNLGVDFGIARTVSGFHIYTDRPSGALLQWSVYVSSDNLVWQSLPGMVQSDYDMNFDRYEIVFAPATARYIKLVNFGVNDVPQVYVTELRAFIESTDDEQTTRRQSVHLAELGGAYNVSKKLDLTGDLTFRAEPKGDFTDSRNQIHYSLGARHVFSPVVTEVVKYQTSIDDFRTGSMKNKDIGLSYSLLVTPLPTLEFSFAALTRSNYINSLKTEETNNLFFQTFGRVLTGLNLSSEAAYSRSNRFDSRTRFDSWNGRVSADSRLTRALDMALYFIYQQTRNHTDNNLRVRRQYNLDFNYRMTSKILVRGSFILNLESGLRYFSQEYSLNWNMSRKLTAGALLTVNESENQVRSERNNIRINYVISSRSTLFLSYTSSAFSLAGRSRIESFQAGLKMGF